MGATFSFQCFFTMQMRWMDDVSVWGVRADVTEKETMKFEIIPTIIMIIIIIIKWDKYIEQFL